MGRNSHKPDPQLGADSGAASASTPASTPVVDSSPASAPVVDDESPAVHAAPTSDATLAPTAAPDITPEPSADPATPEPPEVPAVVAAAGPELVTLEAPANEDYTAISVGGVQYDVDDYGQVHVAPEHVDAVRAHWSL